MPTLTLRALLGPRSASMAAVKTLCESPLARGLFNKAIIMSGGGMAGGGTGGGGTGGTAPVRWKWTRLQDSPRMF